jgi:hypothetical protein
MGEVQTMTAILAAADKYARAGLSVIAVNPADHKTAPKRAVSSWKKYQTQIATGEERSGMFSNGAALAVVCGQVSGNLLVLDFDQPGKYSDFMRALLGNDPELAERLTVHQKTPSGCDHLIVRCSGAAPGNLKLAMSRDGKTVLIETRGAGGYFLTEPSKGYRLTGDLCNPPTITAEELGLLLWLAQQFDQRPPRTETSISTSTDTGDRPGDIYNRLTDWNTLLTGAGWTMTGMVGDREQWTRPGKDRGASATLHPEMGLYVFTTSTNLPNEKPLDRFGYLAWSRFNGDFSQAGKYVRQEYPGEFSGLSGHSGQSKNLPDNPDASGQFPDNLPDTSGQNDRDRGDIAADVREYVSAHSGEVKFSQLCQDIGIFNRREKKTANDAINYMVKCGELEKHPFKRGSYIPTDPCLEIMKPVFEKRVPLQLTFPLDLHNHFNIMPGTVIVIGGATNSGKTVWGMDLLRRWVGRLSGKNSDPSTLSPPHSLRSFVGGCQENGKLDPRLAAIKETGIRYLNSEMTDEELGALLADMGEEGELLREEVQWVHRNHDFPRAVLTDGITVCDYLQIHENFYEIGGTIAAMADKVGAGILVIMIQKKSGESFPRGGEFALERARIALLLDSVDQTTKSCFLRKIKYPADARNHPERKEVEYRIGADLKVWPVSGLRWLDEKQRKQVYKEYSFSP